MIPTPITIAFGWLFSRAKARVERSRIRERMDAYRYDPPRVSLRGIGKIVLLLIATHGYVWWHTKRHALKDFAEASKKLEAEVRKKDAAEIEKLKREVRLAREAEDAALETARKTDEAALKEIEEILKRTKANGWNREIVDAINGDKPAVRVIKGNRRK